jgi:hypothetical protein
VFTCIVMCIPIARQQVGKHIPATQAHATIEGHLLLGNKTSKHASLTIEDGVFHRVHAEGL